MFVLFIVLENLNLPVRCFFFFSEVLNKYVGESEANIRSDELRVIKRPIPSFPGPLYQNEVKCSSCGLEIILQSDANETHFHKKGCALGLILKVRVFGIRK